MLKQTTMYNVSLHLDAKFQKCHLQFDAVSAFSLVQGYSTFSFVQRTIVVYSYLERCLCVSRTLPLSLSNTAAVLSGVVFGPILDV